MHHEAERDLYVGGPRCPCEGLRNVRGLFDGGLYGRSRCRLRYSIRYAETHFTLKATPSCSCLYHTYLVSCWCDVLPRCCGGVHMVMVMSRRLAFLSCGGITAAPSISTLGVLSSLNRKIFVDARVPTYLTASYVHECTLCAIERAWTTAC